jgi:hypothetical protein
MLRHIEHIELPSNRTALNDFNLRTESNRTELTSRGTEPNFQPNFLSTRSNRTAPHRALKLLNRTALGRLFSSIGSIANTGAY